MHQEFERTLKATDGVTRRYHGYLTDIDRVPWPVELFPTWTWAIYTQVDGQDAMTAYVIDDQRATQRYRVIFTDGIWDRTERELMAGTAECAADAIDVALKWIAWATAVTSDH